MATITRRSVARRSNTRTRALTLSKALGDLSTLGVKPRTLGKRRLGARIMHTFDTVGSGAQRTALVLFRHPTKKATAGRMCSLSFAVGAQ